MPGRRHVRPTEPGRWIFNRLADDYPSRPAYPEALVERLAALAARGPVADVGAGTGHLALPLARRGLKVFAVEPARAMLDVLARAAASERLPVQPVHAAGEDTGLPGRSAALVLISDALHWLDPELGGAECRRLLAPGGALAVVEVTLAGTPFLDALWPEVLALNPRARRPAEHPGRRRQLFALAAPGARILREELEDETVLDPRALEGVIRSLSFVGPALGRQKLDQLCALAGQIAARTGGATWRRRMSLEWARTA
jgi:SAM-dependent methyltransferase